IDLAPTLLAAAEVDGLPRRQGRDLTPLWSGEKWEDRDWVLSEYRNSCWPYDPPVHTTMVRRGDWKIVVHHGQPSTERQRDGELYNLANDPDEVENLWHSPEAAHTRLDMERFLLDVLVA